MVGAAYSCGFVLGHQSWVLPLSGVCVWGGGRGEGGGEEEGTESGFRRGGGGRGRGGERVVLGGGRRGEWF